MLKPFNAGLFTNLVKDLRFKDTKIPKKQADEATVVNLEALYRTSDPNVNAYLKTDCGHTCWLQPTHVRCDTFSCKTCVDKRLFEYISKIGCNFLSQKGNNCTILKPCGHVSTITKPSISNCKLAYCNDCLAAERDAIASEKGYSILDVKGKHSLIKFKNCSHTKNLLTSQLLRGNAVCRDCQEDNYRKSTELVGLTIISGTIRRGTGSYRRFKLPCGHEKELRTDHARDGVWACSDCGDGYLTKKSNVYLLKIRIGDEEWLKLGFAQDVDLRVLNYKLVKGAQVEKLIITPFDNGFLARECEMGLHKKYKKDRILKQEMKQFMDNGHSECYPLALEKILISEIKIVKY